MTQMKKDSAVRFVRDRLQRGYTFFSREEAEAVLGDGPSLSNKLRRLAEGGWIMPVGRGFYAIIEPGHQSYGFAPPETFLDAWAAHRGLEYYVGGLSAAEFHGAAHQRSQSYQVVVGRTLRPIEHGGLRLKFFRKLQISSVMFERKTLASGFLRVSTPEATAYDLLFFPTMCRSLSRVATILVELGEVIKPAALGQLASTDCECAALQRLGWLLDHLGWSPLTAPLWRALDKHQTPWRLLDPGLPRKGPRNERWRIIENSDVQPDIEKGTP
jgi:predicted transcriptional regulator of viral defense system